MIRTIIDTLKLYTGFVGLFIDARLNRMPASQNGKRMLLLSPGLPPDSGSGAHRPTSLLKFAPRMGIDIHAASDAPHPKPTEAGHYLRSTIPDSVTIARAPKPSLKASWKLTPTLDGGMENLINLYRLAVAKFKDNPPAVVMSTSPPFYFAVAAYLVAKRLGAKFVMEYRDEWTLCPFDFVQTGKLDHWLEPFLLRRADLVIYTTESHRQMQMETFKGHTDNVVVIPNGWEKDDFDKLPEQALPDKNGKTILSFIGQMAEHSFPTKFLAMLEQAVANYPLLKDKIRVKFIGRKPPEALALLAEFPLQECIQVVDIVSKPDAVANMKGSDALLIFAEPELASYRPGKLYDYLAAKRPVIIMGAKGESSKVVEQMGFGWHVPYGEQQKFETMLLDLVEGKQTLVNKESELDEWLEAHTRENLAKKIIENAIS